MKAIVYSQKGKAEVWNDLVAPELKANEMQLETLYSAVTIGTERNAITGGPYSGGFPNICGYQTVSKVIKTGSEITDYQIGDIVYSDGGSKPVNFEGTSWGGHLEIRNRTAEGNIIKLVSDLDIEAASLLGIMGVGLRATKRGQVKMHDRVLVIGLGLIGQACAQGAAAMGAEVHGIDLMPERLKLASELSCDKVWDASKDGIWDEIKQYGEFDVVFETTGLTGMPDKCLSVLTTTTGRIVAIGGKFDMNYKNLEAQGKEATIIHTSHFSKQELEDLVRLMQKGVINIRPMITHQLSVDESPAIYDQIQKDASGMLGIVFKWNEI